MSANTKFAENIKSMSDVQKLELVDSILIELDKPDRVAQQIAEGFTGQLDVDAACRRLS